VGEVGLVANAGKKGGVDGLVSGVNVVEIIVVGLVLRPRLPVGVEKRDSVKGRGFGV
jgi:hypothetical protein